VAAVGVEVISVFSASKRGGFDRNLSRSIGYAWQSHNPAIRIIFFPSKFANIGRLLPHHPRCRVHCLLKEEAGTPWMIRVKVSHRLARPAALAESDLWTPGHFLPT